MFEPKIDLQCSMMIALPAREDRFGQILLSKSLCWLDLRIFGQERKQKRGTRALAGVCLK
jgi:hypothetical protein